MSKTCNGCNDTTKVTMSSADWQKNEQRHENREKRYIGVIVLLIVLLVATNIGWLVYESQFETAESVTQEEIIVDAQDSGIANYIGQDGNIYNGEDYSQEENHNQNPN